MYFPNRVMKLEVHQKDLLTFLHNVLLDVII